MRLNGCRYALHHYQTSIYDQTPGCMQPSRQPNVPPWGKCISDVLLCSAAKEWGGILTICDCVCVYLDSKLHHSVTRYCILLHLRRFNTAAYRFTLSNVCGHVWYQHVSGMIRCGHADIDFAYPGARNTSIMSVQFLPHILYHIRWLYYTQLSGSTNGSK